MGGFLYFSFKMKYLFIIVFLFLGNKAFACKCDMPSVADSFIAADFVGRFKILKVYPNQSEEAFYKADIEILEQFKGPKIESIYIGGRSDGKLGTSCDIFYPENSDLLVAAKVNTDGKIVFGMCSYTIDFKRSQRDNYRAMETIRLLSNHYEDLTIHYRPYISSNFYDFLVSKRGIKLIEKYAVYEVVLGDQVNATEVNIIKGFGNEIDSEIVNELFNSVWEIRFYPKEDKIEGPIKVIVPVYY